MTVLTLVEPTRAAVLAELGVHVILVITGETTLAYVAVFAHPRRKSFPDGCGNGLHSFFRALCQVVERVFLNGAASPET